MRKEEGGKKKKTVAIHQEMTGSFTCLGVSTVGKNLSSGVHRVHGRRFPTFHSNRTKNYFILVHKLNVKVKEVVKDKKKI